ncbi:MAG: exodeoxyribonuclease VII large subunit [Candidatus Rokubacteria bacterium]|nr:exodeoxyribonuclease VII large subunit [Candidatus Rokubacteria bacterium]MBI4594353.1 exodeoxyribonuclease VII large subunit [Candidatus Rokubacteria bacterium]
MSGERKVLTVSELSEQLRAVVEERFPAVWVEGEISNFKVYASGHAYFTLKDEGAQLRGVLFRNRARRLRFEPGDGQHVLAFGSLEVYAPRGEYQLVVELLEPRGLGALQLAFEQLKARLDAEGLFDPARKRPLPPFPRKIGIVTSPSGAAIRDMLRVIGRRFAGLHIVLAPCRVQGDGAAGEIAQGIADLNALGDVDVIIVGRGGGSLEDLWAFNEEVVARAIAGSQAPVISAVGHEVDFTIADFVADLRAPTPSAAAELVVREKQAVVDSLDELRRRLERAVARPLSDLARRVGDAHARLSHGGLAASRGARHRLALLDGRLRAASPFVRLYADRHRLERAHARLGGDLARRLTADRHRLVAAVGRLDSLSPLAVLGRGYSLALTPAGVVVKSARQVAPGDALSVLLAEGSLDCRVEHTRERDDRPQV